MLDGNSDQWQHQAQNAALVALSVVLLPIDTAFAVLVTIINHLCESRLALSPVIAHRNAARQDPTFRPRTILVTGVGMSKGLVLARIFYEAGHNVIGADFDAGYAGACGRVSRALTRYHALQKPDAQTGSARYVQSLLSIVKHERVDLWVSCSGVASAVEDGEAKEIIEAQTSCKAVQFDAATTQMLHEKDSFIARVQELGLSVPETHAITSQDSAEEAIANAPAGRKFIVKPIGVDDARRGDMTLFPRPTRKETSDRLSVLQISEKQPWILQQFIDGPEYCTHSLVVKGKVKAFAACPSAELLMHYEALPPNSPLSRRMLHFTETFASAGGELFTGHLSFDFMVDRSEADDNAPVLYPIECNPRAHTAVVLFNGMPSLADAYVSLLSPSSSDSVDAPDDAGMIEVETSGRYYWIGHDLIGLIIQPLLSMLTLQADRRAVAQVLQSVCTAARHMISWKDGTFERWDPWPWWWLYHVYWPTMFLDCIWSGKRWSRANVSTTKMFQC